MLWSSRDRSHRLFTGGMGVKPGWGEQEVMEFIIRANCCSFVAITSSPLEGEDTVTIRGENMRWYEQPLCLGVQGGGNSASCCLNSTKFNPLYSAIHIQSFIIYPTDTHTTAIYLLSS